MTGHSPLKVIFFGTSSFAARILSFLTENQVNVVAVVTRPDKPSGRNLQLSPSPVKEIAEKTLKHVPILQPLKASLPEFIEDLQRVKGDLYVVVAYGEILKQSILDLPKKGCVNIHASLLPKYRGAAPIQRCLMAGEEETGITIIEMVAAMDAGPILAQESIPIPLELTFGELEPQLCQLGAKLILDVIKKYSEGDVIKKEQDHGLATFAPKILPEDEKIHWERSAFAVNNQIRALSQNPAPGARSKSGKR